MINPICCALKRVLLYIMISINFAEELSVRSLTDYLHLCIYPFTCIDFCLIVYMSKYIISHCCLNG